MKYSEIYIARKRIDNLFQRTPSLAHDPELLSHWARYLCVIVAGYLETSIAAICVQYTSTKSHKNVTNFVETRLRRFSNPSMEAVCQLVGSFNDTWKRSLETEDDGQMKAVVDSIRANRNRIAHGDWVGLTMGDMTRYYQGADKAVKTIDKMFNL